MAGGCWRSLLMESILFWSIERIKKTIREDEWSIEKLEDVRTREEVGQKRKTLLSFLTRQIKKKNKKKNKEIQQNKRSAYD